MVLQHCPEKLYERLTSEELGTAEELAYVAKLRRRLAQRPILQHVETPAELAHSGVLARQVDEVERAAIADEQPRSVVVARAPGCGLADGRRGVGMSGEADRKLAA